MTVKCMMWHVYSSDILEHKTIQGHASLQSCNQLWSSHCHHLWTSNRSHYTQYDW